VRIQRFRRADVRLADEMRRPRHHDFEFFRIGRERSKQSGLRDPDFRRLGRHRDFYDRRRGWMRFQVQSPETQKRFRVAHRKRQPQRMLVAQRRRVCVCRFARDSKNFFVTALELHLQSDFIRGQHPCGKPLAKLVEQSAQKERERLELAHGRIEFHHFFELRGNGRWNQRAPARATRQFLQAHAFLSQPFGELLGRQRRKRRACPHAPALERFLNFRRRVQSGDGQLAQALGLFLRRENRYAGKAAGRELRRFGV